MAELNNTNPFPSGDTGFSFETFQSDSLLNNPVTPEPPTETFGGPSITDLLAQTKASQDGTVNPNTFAASGEQSFTTDINKAADNISKALSKPSFTAQSRPSNLGDDPNIDRYRASDDFQTFGYVPELGDEQEFRYGRNMSWGDTMGKALGGSSYLAMNTFAEGWKGWGRMTEALINWDSSKLFGSEEERLQAALEQEQVMNKYAIFDTAESREEILNRQFFGNMVQQSGFAVGAGLQWAAEAYLTAGLGKLASAGMKGVSIAKGLKHTTTAAEIINQTRKVEQNMMKTRGVFDMIHSGAKKLAPLYGTVTDIAKMNKAGAGLVQMGMTGLGGIKRELSMFNMARTEAFFEAAGSYKNLRDRLVEEYTTQKGVTPVGTELEKIEQAASDASSDNFYTNTGVLMLMNRIQFDNMFRSFNTTRKLFNEGVTDLASDVFSVTAGNKTRAYQKGLLGNFSAIKKISTDFGKKTAAWEATKSIGKGLMKFEGTEGAQELLQEASNEGLTNYYYDLYHGQKGFTGKMDSVLSSIKNPFTDIEGRKTFLMGALTGRLIAPFQHGVSYLANRKGRAERNMKVQESLSTVNSFFTDPAQFKKEWISNTKVQNKAAETMEEAVAAHDRYVFHNTKDSAFAKTVATAIKLDMFDSVKDSLLEMGADMTDEEFTEAFGLEANQKNRGGVRQFMTSVAKGAEDYYQTYYALKDKYGDRILPELYTNNPAEDKLEMAAAKIALDDAIETLATNTYLAKATVKRAVQIQNELAAIPNIGSSAVDLLTKAGSPKLMAEHKKLLETEISAYSGPDMSAEQKKLLKEKQEELRLVNLWHSTLADIVKNTDESYSPGVEERAYKAYADLLNHFNKQKGLDATVSRQDADDAFIKVVDYIKLNRDHQDYVSALNYLADPGNLELLHVGMTKAIREMGKKMAEEVNNPAETENPVTPAVEKKTVITQVDDKEVSFTTGDVFVGKLSKSTKQIRNKPITIFQNDKITVLDIDGDTITLKVNNDAPVTFDLQEIVELSVSEKWKNYNDLAPLYKTYLDLRDMAIQYRILARDENGKPVLQNGKYVTQVVNGRVALHKDGDRMQFYYVDPATGKNKRVDLNPRFLVNKMDLRKLPDDFQVRMMEEQNRADKNLADQKFYLDNLTKETTAKLAELSATRESNRSELETLEQELEELKTYLELANEDLSKTPYTRGRKSRTRKELENYVKEFAEKINKAEARLTLLQREREELTSLQQNLELANQYYQQALLELEESGSAFDRKGGANLAGEVTSRIEELEADFLVKRSRFSDGDIEQMISDTATEIELLDDQIKYLDDVIQHARKLLGRIAKYEEVYDLLKNTPDKRQLQIQLVQLKRQETDADKLSIINSLIKGLAKGEQGLETQYALELFDRIADSNKELNALLDKREVLVPKLNRLKQAAEQRQEVSSLQERVEFLNTVQAGIADQVARKVSIQTEQRVLDQEAPEDNTEVDNTGATFEFSPASPDFSLIGFGKTAGRHFIDQDDTMVMEADGNARFFKFTESVNLTDGSYVFKVVANTKDDEYGILRKDIFPGDIKVIVVKRKGNQHVPIGVDGKELAEPNRSNIVYSSLHGNNTLLGEDPVPAVKWVRDNFAVKTLTDEQILSKIESYKAFLKEQTSNPGYLPITGKSQGIAVQLPKDSITGLPQELNLEGRLIEDKPDWKDLRHPDGNKVSLVVATQRTSENTTKGVKPGRLVLLKENGTATPTVFRVFNRQLSDSEKSNLLDLFKHLTGLMGRTRTETENEDLKNIITFIKGMVHWGAPAKVAASDNLFFIDKGFLHKGKTGIPFTPTEIEKNAASLTEGLFHRINSRLVNSTEPFTEVSIKNGVVTKKQWQNYIHYLLAPRTEGAPVYTNVPLYSEGINQPQLKSVYLTFAYPELEQDMPKSALAATQPAQAVTSSLRLKFTAEAKPEQPAVQPNSEVKASGNPLRLQFTSNPVVDSSVTAPAPVQPETTIPEPSAAPVDPKLMALLQANSGVSHANEVDGTKFRLSTGPIEELEDFNQFKIWMEQNLPNVHWQKVAHLIGNKGMGAFMNGAIHIFKEAEKGTGFHEAFEAVWGSYLSNEEQAELSAEFRKREGNFTNPFTRESKPYSEATAYDVREMLAEEFRDYILEKKQDLPKKEKSFFRKLWEFIKSLLGSPGLPEFQSKVNALFSKIDTAGFAAAPPVRDLSNLAPVYRSVPGLTQEQTGYLLEGMSYHFFVHLNSQAGSINALVGAGKETHQIYVDAINKSLESLGREFFSLVDQYRQSLGKESFDTNDIAALMAGLRQTNHRLLPVAELLTSIPRQVQFGEIFKLYLKQFGLSFTEVISEEEMEVAENRENTDNPLGIRDAISIDPRKAATVGVRLLIASLPQDVYTNDPVHPIQHELNPLGLPKSANYGRIFNILINELSSITGVYRDGKWVGALDLMFEKLDSKFRELKMSYKQGEDPYRYRQDYLWIHRLKMRLKLNDYFGNPTPISSLNPDDIRLRLDFQNSFTSNKNLPHKLIIGEEGQFYDFNAADLVNADRVREQWLNNTKATAQPMATKSQDAFYGINDQGQIVIDRNSTEYKTVVGKRGRGDIEGQLEALAIMGIEFSEKNPEVLKKHFNSNTLGGLVYVLEQGLANTPEELFGKSIAGGQINELLGLEAKLSGEDSVLSYLNADGESQYAVTTPSNITTILNSLKGVATLQDFIRTNPQYGYVDGDKVVLNAYQSRSLLLKPGGLIFDNKGRKRSDISYHLISGVALATEAEGTNTDELTYPDRVMQEIHYLLQDIHFTIINSDKSSEYGLGFSRPFVPFSATAVVGDQSFAEVEDIYFDQLRDEMDAAIQEHLSPSGIQYYGNRVKELGHYKDILGKQLVDKFTAILTDATKGKPAKQKDLTAAAEAFIQTNKKQILDRFHTHINILTTETLEGLQYLGIVEPVDAEYFQSNALSKALLQQHGINPEKMSGSELTQLVRYLVVNKEIGVAEQHKLIYSHPAQYKDLAKRTNGANSNKSPIAEDKEVTNWMDIHMVRLDGKKRASEELSTFRNISFKDNYAVSTYHQQLAEGLYQSMIKDMAKDKVEKILGARFDKEGRFQSYILKNDQVDGELSAYTNLNEADAQGYILPDMYRDLLFLSSKLSKEQEKQWDYEVAYEINKRSSLSKNHPSFKDYSQERKDWAKAVLAEGNPGIVMQPLKPQYFGYAKNNLMQLAFLKNSVQPKFYRMVEGTAFESIYIEAQEKQIDIIGYESGQKVGNMFNSKGEFVPVYDQEGNANSIAEVPVQELYTRFFGIQTEVPNTVKGTVVRGTQSTKIIMANFKDGDKFTSEEAGDLISEYNSTLEAMIRDGKGRLLKRIGLEQNQDGSYQTTNIQKLVDTLRHECQSRGLPDNQVDALVVDHKEAGQTLMYRFDSLPHRDKIDHILNSIVDSTIISEKMPGKAAVQVASTGFESSSRKQVYLKDGTYHEVTDLFTLNADQRKTVKVTSSDLKFYHMENGKIQNMEVLAPWYFEGVTPEEMGLVLKNGYYAVPEGFDTRLLQSLGFRIPTQGMNSIESITIKGFLPKEMGDVVIVPSEIVGKAGSDFDIDKLQMYLPNYFVQIPTNYEGEQFRSFFVEGLMGIGYSEDSAEKIASAYTPADLKLINQSTYTNKGKEEKGASTSLEELTNGQDEFTHTANVKKVLTQYNAAVKGKKQLGYVETDQDGIASLQNKYREIMQSLLTLPENFRQLVMPNTTASLEALARELRELKGVEDTDSSFLSLRNFMKMASTRERFLAGKRMVGVGALQITSHVLCQISGIKLTGVYDAGNLKYLFGKQKERKVTIRLNHDENLHLHAVKDVAGNWISELQNEALSGFVDAAKNPFIFFLNLNMDTAGTWFYLQKRRVPFQDIGYMFSQPALEKYFHENSINKSYFRKVTNSQLSKEKLMYKAISEYYAVFAGGQDIYKAVAEKSPFAKSLKENFLKNVVQWRAEKPQVTASEMKDAIERMNKPGYKLNREDAKLQITLLLDYLEYNQQAGQMQEFVSAIGYDNKKTKTLQENQIQKSNWDKMMAREIPFIANPEAILDNTFIGEMKEQKESITEMFSPFFVSLDPKSRKVFQPVFDMISNPELFLTKEKKERILQKFQSFYIGYLLHTVPFTTEGRTTRLTDFYDYVTSSNSFPTLLKQLRESKDPNISGNPVIQALLPVINSNRNSTDNIKLLKTRMQTYELNHLIESVINLYDYSKNSQNEELKAFTEQLAIFAIIQSGVDQNTMSLSKILPVELYSKLTKTILDNFIEGDTEINPDLIWKQFHQNNWNDPMIVPKVKFSRSSGSNIILDPSYSDAQYEFVKKVTLRVPKAQVEKLLREGKGSEVFKTTLYQKIEERADGVIYAPINKKGRGRFFLEVATEDYLPSMLEENEKVVEQPYTDSSIPTDTPTEQDIDEFMAHCKGQ